jgi:hypothetical protein
MLIRSGTLIGMAKRYHSPSAEISSSNLTLLPEDFLESGTLYPQAIWAHEVVSNSCSYEMKYLKRSINMLNVPGIKVNTETGKLLVELTLFIYHHYFRALLPP